MQYEQFFRLGRSTSQEVRLHTIPAIPFHTIDLQDSIMKNSVTTAAVAAQCLLVFASVLPRQDSAYAGYLISTFSDPEPSVQQYLSKGNDPGAYTFLNDGKPILDSTVGTGGVRDIYLTHNGDRSQWYLLATGKIPFTRVTKVDLWTYLLIPDLDINAPGFNWDIATRNGSQSLVIWSSSNLVDWSDAVLTTVETPTAGMTWAPSAV